MDSSNILSATLDNYNNSCNSSKHKTSIHCCFNVEPASQTVLQHLSNKETSQCVYCFCISQTNIYLYKSTKAQWRILISEIEFWIGSILNSQV